MKNLSLSVFLVFISTFLVQASDSDIHKVLTLFDYSKADIKEYLDYPKHKAIAVSKNKTSKKLNISDYSLGYSYGWLSVSVAKSYAKYYCNNNKTEVEVEEGEGEEECVIIVLDNEIVHADLIDVVTGKKDALDVFYYGANDLFSLSEMRQIDSYIKQDRSDKNIKWYVGLSDISFSSLLTKIGRENFVMRWRDEDPVYNYDVKLPKGSYAILSDYGSSFAMEGATREWDHLGIDFNIPPGKPILAVVDGTISLAHTDTCMGPSITLTPTHKDKNKKIFWSYIHLGELKVKKGDEVKRGETIAFAGGLMGNKHECAGSKAHLHFSSMNHKYFMSATDWPNPHDFWTLGKGRPECFVTGNEYPSGKPTLPFKCK